MRRPLILLLLLALFGLGGCGALRAQNPSGALSPVNAVADDDDAHVMLFGHDVVAYFTESRHRLGSSRFESMQHGVTFRFATAEHKALFDKQPKNYIPQYGGFCANGIVYGIPWGGDADSWRIFNGKLYIFGGAGSREAYLLDVPANTALADKYWKDEVAGSNSMFQRSWRLINRVPHYKSGEELARMVAAAKAKKG